MKKLSIITVLLLIVSAVWGQTKSDLQFIEQTLENRGEIVLRFPHNGNRELVNELGHIISIDKITDAYVEAYANAREYEQFKTYGIEYEPVYEYYRQTRALNMATSVAQMANWDRYPTYAVYLEMMHNYATNYPTLCKMDTIGYSVNNRPIITMVISDNIGTNEDEPEFWWSSTMHGDETTGWYFMIRLVDYLLTNYGTDAQVTNLVNNMEIYISPLTNPDGTFSGSSNGTSIANATRTNANGTDLNRSFPDINGYAGTSDPEVTMVKNYAAAHHFVMAANGHGGTECINYPWDEQNWTSSTHPHPDDNWWQYVCFQYADTCHAINSRYFKGPGSSYNNTTGVTEGCDWYYTEGGRQDYMNYFHHCRELTLEWSNEKTLGTENLNTYWGYNRKAILNFTEQALYGFRGIVTDACTNQPLSGVKVFINNHDADNSEVYTATPVGDYHRPIYAGTYSVTFSKDGYVSKTFTVTTQNMASVRLDVSLCPEPSFTTNPPVAYEGRSIQFNNTLEACTTSTSWTFEGASPATSTAANPTVIYNAPGTYNVSLSTVSDNGCSSSTTGQITVYEAIPPEADFSASETLVSIGGSVNFTDLSTNMPTSWQWTFEGGTPATSNEQNPTVTYEEPGVYSVTLVASNAFGSDTETKTAYIEVVSIINMSNDTIHVCSGTYKDPGGDGNYPNSVNYTQTIYPSTEGAYVRLTFNQFSLQAASGWQQTCSDKFYIYDGTSTSANVLVNGVCGTSNPGTITATNDAGALTIVFTSNNATNAAGWEAEISCYAPEPEAAFTAVISENCTRNITITNESEHATSYLWAFGDGTTSTEVTPTHTYAANGTYTITLTATNAFGSNSATQQIEVSVPEISSVTNASGCGSATLTLSAQGNGTLHWFDAHTGGTELGTGESYSANFNQTTTLYVEAQQGSEETYNVGIANNSSASSYTQNGQNRGLTFTVSQNITLMSVDVYCTQNNLNRTITITNNSNSQSVYSQSHTLSTGLNTLNLNVELEPGTYNIYANNVRYTYRQTGSFPYSIDNVISITGQYNYNGYGTQYYYTFYNWVVTVENTCTSERTAVTATVIESGEINLGEPIVQCGGTATLNAGSGFDSYSWSNQQTTQSIIVAQSGTYSVTATNGQCQSTGSVVVTINPIPSLAITENGNTLTANATSGTGNYQYNWSTNATTQSIAVTSDGNYCVTTTDSNNCTAMACSSFSLPDIDIIISNVEHGSISGENSVEYGSNYTFTVIPDACYEIGTVTVNGSEVILDANNSYTIQNVTAEQTINATFNRISYTITASAGNGGTISPAGDVEVNCGESKSFSIAANEGYMISDVLVDGQSIGAQSAYTFTNVNANHSISATFEEIPPEEIVIVVNADSNGGSVYPSGTQTITEGENFTFIVTPNACYEIGTVTVNGTAVELDANNSYTITNVTSEQAINVTFNQIVYTIAASAENGGTINANNTANCGENFTFSVTPDNCYEIGTVTVNGNAVDLDANNSYTIENVTADQNINVNFNLLSYTITASAGNGGTITPSGDVNVDCGESKVFAIAANEGYMISDVLVDGQSVGTQSSYTFTNVDADHTISATFAEIPDNHIVITVNADTEGGSVSPSGTQSIEQGEDFTFNVTPNACYVIGSVTVNGTAVTLDDNNSYTINNVTTEQTINVTFNLITYTITASAGNGGTITPAGDVVVNCGESKTFTITANEGYEIADVTVDGLSVGAVENYTFPSVSENGHSIVATFSEIVVVPECNAVTNLTAQVESYGVVLSWNVAENATSYEIYRNGERIATETGTSSIDLQGHEGDTYYIITNCVNGGTSDASETATAEAEAICNAVTDLTVRVESYGVVLSWNAAENATSYEVYRNGERIATETNTSSVDLQGHEGDTYYIITNCANGGTSDASETATAIVTGISEVKNNIAIFPNPATDILNITSSEEISEIEIVNTLGQVVYRKEVNSDNAVCDIEDLPSGVYMVRIRTLRQAQGAEIQKKFVKE